MYVIMVYDVHVDRVARVLKVGRKYLTWVQNSVLEGELSKGQFARLKAEVRAVVHDEEDSVLFYLLRSEQWLQRETIGVRKAEPSWML